MMVFKLSTGSIIFGCEFQLYRVTLKAYCNVRYWKGSAKVNPTRVSWNNRTIAMIWAQKSIMKKLIGNLGKPRSSDLKCFERLTNN